MCINYTCFRQKFGLYRVDFTDPARPRSPKDSARFYQQVIQDNGFPVNDQDSDLGPPSYNVLIFMCVLGVGFCLFVSQILKKYFRKQSKPATD